ncbi:trypsin-like peptidase domain-containing protein [Sporosarcina sp. USHLN248]|uniref:trypsin-like peptidase domain-containing protein n=1 Tax=Sporosarcina sp. USHLN248 TaxID=3081300 RepID=UPI003018A9AB
MICRKCGQQNEEGKFCSNCGAQMKAEHKNSRRKWIWIASGASVAAFVAFCIGVYSLISFVLSPADSEQAMIENEVSHNDDSFNTVETAAQLDNNELKQSKDKTLVIKEAMPKVFTIYTEDSMGSGFLYREGGYIITNAHVVAGYSNVIVRNSKGEDSLGKLIGISDEFDIALIQAEDYRSEQPLPIDLEESDIGLEVIALGSPQGFENSASIGYLTGIGRDIDFGFTYKNLYQVDAQIDQGSSGGPLLDAKTGKVIGINSLLYTNQNNFAFSIPAYSMIDIVDSWVEKPMTDREISKLFDLYESFIDDNAANTYFDDEVYDYYFDESSLEAFILDFRRYYEMALYYEDFYWIEDMVLIDSDLYDELYDHIDEVNGKDIIISFESNEVTDVKIDEKEEYAIVTTYETVKVIEGKKKSTMHEEQKEYNVIIDEEGYYQITDITTK